MSYEHLAGRLIETQRSMLGEPAVDIARSIEGIAVTDDGNVSAVEGDGRAVVDELARRYTDMLGGAAEDRLLAAAREFEDELALPPSLGGPEEFDAGHRDPATHDTAGSGPAAGAVSDGGTATISPGPAPSAEAGVSLSEPVTVEYTVASDLAAGSDDGDLAAVYLLPAGEGDWQAPVAVEDAVVDAVAGATDLDPDDLGDVAEPIDAERLLATLNGDGGETVSFQLRGPLAGLTVTFHRSGSLAVH